MSIKEIVSKIEEHFSNKSLTESETVNGINELRKAIHLYSPFKSEPVDYVEWVKADNVEANKYNPNSVAPPEMELLRLSILSDGYTQPIVAWKSEDKIEVIDGFHRNRVGKECPDVRARIKGYLPIVGIKNERQGKSDRIASTIRHNRARGKHAVDAMSDIVVELKKRNWASTRIAKELGMDADEVLRLSQMSGIATLFADDDFSMSWEARIFEEDDIEEIFEEIENGQEKAG